MLVESYWLVQLLGDGVSQVGSLPGACHSNLDQWRLDDPGDVSAVT
jgi:hypothetical protein